MWNLGEKGSKIAGMAVEASEKQGLFGSVGDPSDTIGQYPGTISTTPLYEPVLHKEVEPPPQPAFADMTGLQGLG